MPKSRPQDLKTVQERLFWAYANLARADAAIRDGSPTYTPTHHAIRARLFRGLSHGTMAVGSLYADEKIKLTEAPSCSYCGSVEDLTIDHLIPKFKSGTDQSDNLIRACRKCNSSKGVSDLLEWHQRKDLFPPIVVLRRYLKLAIRFCHENDLLMLDFDSASRLGLPFRIDLVPTSFPPLSALRDRRADRSDPLHEPRNTIS